ncbi:MAG: chemoreceptor glutamine deamidase CheD [Terriglobia bacterium]|jgi:chemotaxis protein CheD
MIRVRHVSGTADTRWKQSARVYTGDVATSTRPVVLEAVLGSCVAVCLHDPFLSAGGMNHILLPGRGRDERSTRFGQYAMEVLINELMKHGADRRRLVAKAFGGANVLRGLTKTAIGSDNATFVREFLSAERIPLIAERLGGKHPIEVHFYTDTGKAKVRCVNCAQCSNVVHAESSYWRAHLRDRNLSGEITLF